MSPTSPLASAAPRVFSDVAAAPSHKPDATRRAPTAPPRSRSLRAPRAPSAVGSTASTATAPPRRPAVAKPAAPGIPLDVAMRGAPEGRVGVPVWVAVNNGLRGEVARLDGVLRFLVLREAWVSRREVARLEGAVAGLERDVRAAIGVKRNVWVKSWLDPNGAEFDAVQTQLVLAQKLGVAARVDDREFTRAPHVAVANLAAGLRGWAATFLAALRAEEDRLNARVVEKFGVEGWEGAEVEAVETAAWREVWRAKGGGGRRGLGDVCLQWMGPGERARVRKRYGRKTEWVPRGVGVMKRGRSEELMRLYPIDFTAAQWQAGLTSV